jgi:hypothetical protein
MTPTIFRYDPLAEPDSIRLLLLEPSDDADAELRGSFVHTTTRERADDILDGFIALSYCWGDPTPTSSISVGNGQYHVGITASLDTALRGVRDARCVCRLWVDALCIDQQNVKEKNQQIPLMGSIYEAADHTIIFLGPPTADAEMVLRRAGRWHELGEEERQETFTMAARDILRRPWFSRTWVLQELVLSRDPLVQCGRVRTRWMSLRALFRGATAGALQAFHVMDEIRSDFYRRRRSLLEILCMRRATEASDPHDMVYGVLGLVARTENWPAALVDYSLAVELMYTTAARHSLAASPSGATLQMLLSAANDTTPLEERQRPRLPSWVPDWTRGQAYPAPVPDTFMASRYVQPEGTWHTTANEPAVLVCRGRPKFWREVHALGPVFPPPSTLPAVLRDRCRACFSKAPRYGSGSLGPRLREYSVGGRSSALWLASEFDACWKALFNAIQPSSSDGPRWGLGSSDAGSMLQQAFGLESNLVLGSHYIPEDSGMRMNLAAMVSLYLEDGDGVSAIEGRRLAVLGYDVDGMLAIVPFHTTTGDVCTALGASLRTYVLRRSPDRADCHAILQAGDCPPTTDSVSDGLPVEGSYYWGRLVGESFVEYRYGSRADERPRPDNIVLL